MKMILSICSHLCCVYLAIEALRVMSHWGSINKITKFMRIRMDQYVNNILVHNKLYAFAHYRQNEMAIIIIIMILYIAIE